MPRLLSFFLASLVAISAHASAPDTFAEAKVIAKQKVYFDQNTRAQGDLYCGCKWEWVGKSGGRADAASCGYQTRKQQSRADRTEWEHIVPVWTFGHQRQCWQNGGREHCVADDPVFRAMEGDLFNLYPAVGEVNGDRANFNYGMAQGVQPQYGQCSTKIDFRERAAEPRDEVKGLVARVTFYMFDRYALNMSRQQQLLMAWDQQHPVTTWERERDQRIASVVGHSNPFVSGERHWTLGYKPVGDGVVSPLPALQSAPVAPSEANEHKPSRQGVIIGNRNSHVYHLPEGCPSYSKVSPKNQVHFASEAEAKEVGFAKAGNCSP